MSNYQPAPATPRLRMLARKGKFIDCPTECNNCDHAELSPESLTAWETVIERILDAADA